MRYEEIDKVLLYAIDAERRAATSYRELAERSDERRVKDLALALAVEEESHLEALERVREGDLTMFAGSARFDFELAAPSTALDLAPDMSPARMLLAAIDREQVAFNLYRNLAEMATEPGLRTLLESLARAEIGHWKALDQVYDDLVGDGGRGPERPKPQSSSG